MTKQQYLEIREDESKDTLPVLHYFFKLKGGVSLSFTEFNYCFSHWLIRGAMRFMPDILFKVFSELDEHFKLKQQ